jgi:hypothetical protein
MEVDVIQQKTSGHTSLSAGGSSHHSTTRARDPLPLFQSGSHTKFKTQGSALLYPQSS